MSEAAPADADHRPMSRYRAAGYHFLVSLGIFAVLAGCVFFWWFPGFFYTIDGGWEGLRLIIFVDLVIGPFLTLIVFKAGKPGLKFDLTLIALVQATCLAGGIYVVYNERPTFFIYYEEDFYSASAGTFGEYGVIAPNPAKFGGAPAMVAVNLPDDPIEEADIRRFYYRDQVPLWTASNYYVPLEEKQDEILAAGRPEAVIRARDPDNNLDRWLERKGGTFEDYAFLPIHSRYRNAYLGVRRSDGSFAGLLEVQAPKPALPVEQLPQPG